MHLSFLCEKKITYGPILLLLAVVELVVVKRNLFFWTTELGGQAEIITNCFIFNIWVYSVRVRYKIHKSEKMDPDSAAILSLKLIPVIITHFCMLDNQISC